jgi:hypothetical protein
MSHKTCRQCGETYAKSEKEIDDGYCDFSCWEEANCKMPEAHIFNDTVDEILAFKN